MRFVLYQHFRAELKDFEKTITNNEKNIGNLGTEFPGKNSKILERTRRIVLKIKIER